MIKESFTGTHLEKTIIDIEHRHEEILHLEQQIQEIYEMMRDFSLLIDLQQEKLNIIEVRVKNSVQSVDEGTKNLGIADKYSKKNQRRIYMICCLFLIIMCVILFPLLKTQTNLL
jgi:t-SNARE complex subunit (syntaxin)